MTETKDFSDSIPEPLTFTFDGYTFATDPEMPAGVLLGMSNLQKKIRHATDNGEDISGVLTEAMSILLDKKSLAEFMSRVNGVDRDKKRPISMVKFQEILGWLLEELPKKDPGN